MSPLARLHALACVRLYPNANDAGFAGGVSGAFWCRYGPTALQVDAVAGGDSADWRGGGRGCGVRMVGMDRLSRHDYELVDFSDERSLLDYAKKLEGHTFREVLHEELKKL